MRFLAPVVALWAGLLSVQAAPATLNPDLQLRLVLANAPGANCVRLAKDPRDSRLHLLRMNGDIFGVALAPGAGSSSMLLYTAADHGVPGAVGMAFGPDGTLFLVGNADTNSGNSTLAVVRKGVPGPGGSRTWSLLARTEPYPRSRTAFDHRMNGIVVSHDGAWLYLNSGSRTDHGEVQSASGAYPNLRETALTTKILRLPANASNLILSNDISALESAGYVFAQGTRNAFDLAFAPNGQLFATDNGPDRDMADELNWIRQGGHYGFPWRMGGADNPQQFPDYDPASDRLLDPRFIAVQSGAYHNDPSFPPPPTNFFEPVINLGPDANSYRDPADGSLQRATNGNQTLGSVTAHRSPLGLVFDNAGAMAPPFQGHGFMLSWTPGDPGGDSVAGPFLDPSQDVLDLDLTSVGTNYHARFTRIAQGFSNPIDSEVIGNKLYVLEFGGSQGIWEITFPPAPARLTAARVGSEVVIRWQAAGALLQANELGPEAAWSVVVDAPNTPSGGSYTNTAGSLPTYYRLQQ